MNKANYRCDDKALSALFREEAVPGVRGLKVKVVKPGKRNAYLRALGLDPAKVPQIRHNRKIKLRLV